ncbi:endonuclease domain-containing 1 protein-like [Pygocentrus nattereri]|uniref:Endonuclease n=1 Tax=Pygocentrus nattereri TaxID=42514 RepID=A0A3B4CCP5_PYGNA|nr:endonuclease domain-containing 1 protein-like [Pygocentrus nattereri]XP_017572798.1 endonuclease domain-containing 1 protein-like [Pygocentrus nattereri]
MVIMNLFTLVLLLLTLSRCSSEVVNSSTQTCPQFFADPGGALSPPTVFPGNNYKEICQILGNTYEYATLYDTANRIPVYSAYRFNGYTQCTRQSNWYIEPQLENINYSKKMATESSVTNIQNQAVNDDYANSGYDRGHLAPVLHATSQSCSDATFTLTNAAPQDKSFNRGQWRITEKAVADTLVQNCKGNSAYIVTGVVPGTGKLKNRVRIPSYFWTAYCCLDNNQQVKAASGFLGQNKNVPVQEMSIKNLDTMLSGLYGPVFNVFGGKCN